MVRHGWARISSQGCSISEVWSTLSNRRAGVQLSCLGLCDEEDCSSAALSALSPYARRQYSDRRHSGSARCLPGRPTAVGRGCERMVTQRPPRLPVVRKWICRPRCHRVIFHCPNDLGREHRSNSPHRSRRIFPNLKPRICSDQAVPPSHHTLCGLAFSYFPRTKGNTFVSSFFFGMRWGH